ncbi:M14 family metallocarboxypeptidase [Domibacillus sp. PGB-M46]|uniref:M14 family metallopeptidase n=1 Tax=Domibacillus sp. PGB-M46 TaxID=2910255 RepID=UPI001F59EC44|nr:M14 family metallocarboxypeptidase [Domibacillus sp. PGB-M46]MCI2253045.1 M14 family metallocarboxypeptidase [Domibacillus sp. PGB-M46]
MKKWLSFSLIVLLLSALLPSTAAQAASYLLTKVDTTIYTPPSSAEQQAVLTPIPARTNVKVIEEQETRIRVSWQGINGFIAKEDLIIEENGQAEASGSYIRLEHDAELFQKKNGAYVKTGRLLTGEIFKKTGTENGYVSFVLGNTTAYVSETAVTYLPEASLAGGVQPGYVFQNRAITRKTVDLLYSKNGRLTSLGRLQAGTLLQTRAAYRDYYIVDIGGRTAYILKTDMTLYTGNYVNPFKTMTYEQMVQDLKELALWHSDIASLEVIGKSVDGRSLYALRLGTGKEEVLLNGSHHAREHITTNVVMEMADQYAHLFQTNGSMNGYPARSILKKTSIYMVPMVNPDGVSLVQLGAGSAKNKDAILKLNGGSTNFSAWKANIRGVDLNRQYPADWRNICCNPGKPSSQNYKGPSPLSEPESKAMYDFTLKHSFKASAAYHSSGQIIYWHYYQSGARKSRDLAVAKRVSQKTGYSLVAPQSNPSGGGYTDWFIQNEQKPGLTIEVSPYVGSRPVPIVYFSSIWQQNNSVGLMLANETIQ